MLAAVAATACWGAGTTLTKLALAWFEPSFLLVLQLAVSLSGLVLWLTLSAGERRMRLVTGASWLGLLEPGLAYFLGLAGLQRIGAAEAVLLSSTESILVILLAWALAIERPRASVLLLAAAGTLGALLVSLGRDGLTGASVSVAGDVLLLGGVLCAAGYVVWSSRRAAVTEPLPALIGQQAVALLFAVLMHGVVSSQRWSIPAAPAEGWLLAAASGLVQYAAAFWLYLWALKGLSAAEAGLSLTLIPVFGLLFAIPLLRESLTRLQWCGALLTVAAVALLTWCRRERAVQAGTEPAAPAPVWPAAGA
jgi:drug/metabolite transporter (DMT)-like permease